MDRMFREVRQYLLTRIESLTAQGNAASELRAEECRDMLRWLDRWYLLEELADAESAEADGDA